MDNSVNVAPVAEERSFSRIMAPLVAAVFCSYVTIGIALGILPVYMHNTLGYSSVTIGIIVGLQFIATLSTRSIAGNSIDRKGVKKSFDTGTVIAFIAGLLYCVAGYMPLPALICVCLVLGRILSGFSESFQITGAMTWAIGLVGSGKSGKVMAWNGIAMYGGLAAGAPTGIFLLHYFGIKIAFLSIVLLPVIAWLAVVKMPTLAVQQNTALPKIPFLKVVRLVGKYGFGLAFSALGFGCISSFISLMFQQKGWPDASMAFILFGAGYIGVRLFFAHLPDKLGGNKIAFISLIIEMAGQILLWRASSPEMALTGAALSGIGFSLVFPAFGVEAVKNVMPTIRGSALGAYVAFFDVSLSITGPLAGYIAGRFNYPAVYLLGTVGCLVAAALAFSGIKMKARPMG
jgi:MFS family permease